MKEHRDYPDGFTDEEQYIVAIGEMELGRWDRGIDYDQAKIDRRNEVLHGSTVQPER